VSNKKAAEDGGRYKKALLRIPPGHRR
jgi:hypothetical protein